MDAISLLINKLPKDAMSAMFLRDKLDKIDKRKKDELMQMLPMLNLKNPTTVFWVGCFLLGSFGVGRFMVGDIVLGIVRMALGILDLSLCILHLNANPYELSDAYTFVWLLVWLADLIWWITDMFLVSKKARQQNLDKILAIIK